MENFVRLFLCESQSPIGTNKTFVAPPRMPTFSLFQSPIGTNKTNELFNIDLREVEFQSPIGTNKTGKRLYTKGIIQNVSIPYRYKQNVDEMLRSGGDIVCFNPL